MISIEKIFVAQNTIDTTTLFSIRRRLAQESREQTKQRLGLSRTHYLCFIGEVEKRKNPFVILDLLLRLRDDGLDMGAIIIGDGPLLTSLRQRATELGLSDVHMTGEITALEDSAPYIYVSDALVIPDFVGLAINQGLSLGVPLVTQYPPKVGRQHSPEIDYLIDGKTGFQAPRDDMDALADRVRRVTENRKDFYDSAVAFAEENLQPQRWVEGMISAIDFAVSHHARHH